MFDKIAEVVVGAYHFSPLGLFVLTGVFLLIIVDCIRILWSFRK